MKRSLYAAVLKLPAYRRYLIATLIDRFGDSVDAAALYAWVARGSLFHALDAAPAGENE